MEFCWQLVWSGGTTHLMLGQVSLSSLPKPSCGFHGFSTWSFLQGTWASHKATQAPRASALRDRKWKLPALGWNPAQHHFLHTPLAKAATCSLRFNGRGQGPQHSMERMPKCGGRLSSAICAILFELGFCSVLCFSPFLSSPTLSQNEQKKE